MASALLRTSARRGSAFLGVLSEAAAPSGGKGLAVSLAPSPIRRLQHSGSGDPANSLKEKVDLLHQSIKDVNRKVEKAHVVYASIQKLVEDKKPYNPFVQWLWQMGAVAVIVFVEHKRGSEKNDE